MEEGYDNMSLQKLLDILTDETARYSNVLRYGGHKQTLEETKIRLEEISKQIEIKKRLEEKQPDDLFFH